MNADNRTLTADQWAAFADGLMAAGDRLAEQLYDKLDVENSPWTQQILDEWAEAKDISDLL